MSAEQGASNEVARRMESDSDGGLRLVHSAEEELSPPQRALALSVKKLAGNRVRVRAPWAMGDLFKELRAHAMLGAVKAARRFDASGDTQFPSYAIPWMDGAIIDRLEKDTRHWTLLRAAKTASAQRAASAAGRAYLAEEPSHFRVVWDTSETAQARHDELVGRLLGAMVIGAAYESLGPEESAVENETDALSKAVIERVKATMSDRMRDVILMCIEKELPQQKVAEALGIDARSVRRILNKALDLFAAALRAEGITGPPPIRDRE